MLTSGVYGEGDEFQACSSFNIVDYKCQDSVNANDFVTVCDFGVIG